MVRATFPMTSGYFICRNCYKEFIRRDKIAGAYAGRCVFRAMVNTNDIPLVPHMHQCSVCNEIMGVRFEQFIPHLGRQRSFFTVTMKNLDYWNGEKTIEGDDGLKAMLNELGIDLEEEEEADDEDGGNYIEYF